MASQQNCGVAYPVASVVVLAAGISPAKPALPRNPTDGLSKLEGVVAENRGRGPLSVPAISAIQDDPGSKNCIAPLAKRAGGIALVPAVVSFHAVLNPAVHEDERQGKPTDWREAAIFVVRDDGTPAVDPVSPDRAPDSARSPVPGRPEKLTPPQPEGLFVARNAGGDRP